jgi:hypothetical protein
MPGRNRPSGLGSATRTGKQGDVLIDDRLRLDLLDRSGKRQPRKGSNADPRRLSGRELADVRLVDERPDADLAQICHLEQRGSTADVGRRRGDHLPNLHALAQDRAVGWRAHFRVLESDTAFSTSTRAATTAASAFATASSS